MTFQKINKGRSYGFIQAILVLSFFSVGLSLYRIWITGTDRYWFLMWNLFLAWLPLVFAWFLYQRAPKGLTWSWENLAWATLWLLFLPNAFYLLSDFVHLKDTGEVGIMYDVVLLASYSCAGLVLGFTSLYMVHVRMLQRFGRRAHLFVLVALLLSGFAIYLGRYLRWNSWDIITNPFALLFDVSDQIVNPAEHVVTFTTTLLFFTFLSVLYFVIWRAIRLAQSQKIME